MLYVYVCVWERVVWGQKQAVAADICIHRPHIHNERVSEWGRHFTANREKEEREQDRGREENEKDTHTNIHGPQTV